MDIVIARQPPRVMLELAEHPAPEQFIPASARDTSGPTGTEDQHPEAAPPPGISVVIVEPPQQQHIPELRHALASYYPQVRCYRYEAHGPDGQPRLDAFDLPVETSPPQNPSEHGAAPAASPNNASPHIKGSGQRLRSVVVKAPDRPAAHDAPLVSEEELTMLLGPDQPFEETHPHNHAGPEGE